MTVVRYEETPAGLVRRAFGIGDQDVAKRAKTLLDEAELRHRSVYGQPPPGGQWRWEAAVAAAAAETGTPWIVTTTDELAARVRRQNPLCRWGVVPEVADARIMHLPRTASRG